MCASVAEIDEPVDVVSFYVPAPVAVRLLPAIAARSPGELWLNPGAENAELRRAIEELGLKSRRLCSIIELGYTPADFT